ncbi:hypothetical protein CDIK_3201, partial [Cucumispora dikerogammari]
SEGTQPNPRRCSVIKYAAKVSSEAVSNQYKNNHREEISNKRPLLEKSQDKTKRQKVEELNALEILKLNSVSSIEQLTDKTGDQSKKHFVSNKKIEFHHVAKDTTSIIFKMSDITSLWKCDQNVFSRSDIETRSTYTTTIVIDRTTLFKCDGESVVLISSFKQRKNSSTSAKNYVFSNYTLSLKGISIFDNVLLSIPDNCKYLKVVPVRNISGMLTMDFNVDLFFDKTVFELCQSQVQFYSIPESNIGDFFNKLFVTKIPLYNLPTYSSDTYILDFISVTSLPFMLSMSMKERVKECGVVNELFKKVQIKKMEKLILEKKLLRIGEEKKVDFSTAMIILKYMVSYIVDKIELISKIAASDDYDASIKRNLIDGIFCSIVKKLSYKWCIVYCNLKGLESEEIKMLSFYSFLKANVIDIQLYLAHCV